MQRSLAALAALLAVTAVLTSISLAAGCSSSNAGTTGSDAGGDATSGDATSNTDGGSPSDSAGGDAIDAMSHTDGGSPLDSSSVAPPGFPQVPRNQPDAGLFTSLRVVTIVPANYGTAADETQLDAWGDYVVKSPWLKATVGEYGCPTTGTSAHLSGPAITDATYTNALAEQYITSLVATDAGGAYAPDGHTFYALYVPPGTTFNQTYCGYHFKFAAQNGDAIALIRTCTDAGLTSLQTGMLTAGHELVEALTDTPGGAGYTLNGSLLSPPALTPWAFQENTNGTPHSELGDLCGGTRWSENGITFTRIWSNQAAAAGGDPCAPAVTQPYYNVKSTVSWVATPAGQTATIPLTGWTHGGTTTDWELEVAEVANSTQSASSTANLVTPSLKTATSTTVNGKTYPTINDGKTATLTVPVPASAAHGAWAAVEVKSTHLDAQGKPALDPDIAHPWFVGIYVL